MLRDRLRRLVLRLYRLVAVRHGVKLGKCVHIGIGSIVSAPNHLEIADEVYIGKYCTIQCDGQIGRWVLIGNNVGIVGRHDHDHRQVGVPIRWASWIEDPGRQPRTADIIEIQEDVWIGYGSTILSGVTVGRGSVIGAGAVVVSSVPPYSIVRGNPATIIGSRFSPDEIETHERMLRQVKL
jgi:acetyltransferase-like isoleucine patch superfamily enzyme